MKQTQNLYGWTIAFSLLFLTACGGKEKEKTSTDSINPEISVVTEDVEGILSLPAVSFTDTLTIDGKIHQYTIDITPVDTLPVVINGDGVKYHDNSIRLTVTQAKDTLFDHTFTKQSFVDYIKDIDSEQVALVNCRYNINADSPALSFVAYVADPDDNIEVERNIEIRVLSDGKYSLQAIEDPEMEPIDSSNRLNPERYE